MPGSLLIISVVHNIPISKTLLYTTSYTLWDYEPCFNTKFVMTQTEALSMISILNHEGPRDPLACNHKHNPYINQSVKDIKVFNGNL